MTSRVGVLLLVMVTMVMLDDVTPLTLGGAMIKVLNMKMVSKMVR